MPLRLCTFGGCKAVVEVSPGNKSPARCDKHPLRQNTPKRIHEHQLHNGKNLYKTTEWQRLRDAYARRQPLCEHCLQYNIVTPGVIVDHIVEISDGGGKLDWNNLQHLCNACHNVKTGREKVKRRKKKENGGFGSLSDF